MTGFASTSMCGERAHTRARERQRERPTDSDRLTDTQKDRLTGTPTERERERARARERERERNKTCTVLAAGIGARILIGPLDTSDSARDRSFFVHPVSLKAYGDLPKDVVMCVANIW